MKKSISIVLFVFALAGFSQHAAAQSAKTVSLTVSWSFKGIVDGYDHDNKTEVYIDGTLAGTSGVAKESKNNSVTVSATKGKHDVKVVNYALYDGTWEEHTIANNYSQDCTFNDNLNLSKKKNKLVLLFDLDNGTKRVK